MLQRKVRRSSQGGRRPEERNPRVFLEPTVLVDVPDRADIMQEESFGHVAPIARFSTFDEAIEKSNSRPFGFSAYAFTGNHEKAERLFRELHAGMVGVNTFLVAHAQAPFGGIDHSGMGREGGREAIRNYQNTKLTHMVWD